MSRHNHAHKGCRSTKRFALLLTTRRSETDNAFRIKPADGRTTILLHMCNDRLFKRLPEQRYIILSRQLVLVKCYVNYAQWLIMQAHQAARALIGGTTALTNGAQRGQWLP